MDIYNKYLDNEYIVLDDLELDDKILDQVNFDLRLRNYFSRINNKKSSIIFNRANIDTLLFPLKRMSSYMFDFNFFSLNLSENDIYSSRENKFVDIFYSVKIYVINYDNNTFNYKFLDEFVFNNYKNDPNKSNFEVKKFVENICEKYNIDSVFISDNKAVGKLMSKINKKRRENNINKLTIIQSLSFLNAQGNINVGTSSLLNFNDLLSKYFHNKNFSLIEQVNFILNFANKLCFNTNQIDIDKKNTD